MELSKYITISKIKHSRLVHNPLFVSRENRIEITKWILGVK